MITGHVQPLGISGVNLYFWLLAKGKARRVAFPSGGFYACAGFALSTQRNLFGSSRKKKVWYMTQVSDGHATIHDAS
jgi:hypothetical protein